MSFPVLIIGAGRIGITITQLLHASGDYHITLADRDSPALSRVEEMPDSPCDYTLCAEINSDVGALVRSLGSTCAESGIKAIISACTFQANRTIAAAARRLGVSYFDLTEDVETAKYIRFLADPLWHEFAAPVGAEQVFMPQCGLAPGFISILAASMAHGFDKLDSLKLRVGALPQYPDNQLMYNLTWSTGGLINEYCRPCSVLHKGSLQEVPALSGLEHFAVDGIQYEAFSTSGGLGTLCETLSGQVNELNYKTVRLPGHHYLMDFLLNGLRLGDTDESRLQLAGILERALPTVSQDLVLVMCTAAGWRNGVYRQESEVRRILPSAQLPSCSAIQLTTASAACVMVDLLREDKLPVKSGFVKQEDVPLETFLTNRFARCYCE